jgi:hypothetical protein
MFAVYISSAPLFINEKICRILKSTRQQPYQFHDVPCGSMPGILQYNQQVRTSAGTSMKRIDFLFQTARQPLVPGESLLSILSWSCLVSKFSP